MVAAKLDADGARDRLEVVREWFAPRFPVVPISAQTGEGLESLRTATYDLLGVLRVYTKVPGKTGRSDQAVHAARRQHDPGPRQGDSSGF